MFRRIIKALHRIFGNFKKTPEDSYIPKVAPSADEAILPIDPEEFTIYPYELKQMMDTNREFVLLDVREEWEFQIVHFDGAVSIPLGELPRRYGELSPLMRLSSTATRVCEVLMQHTYYSNSDLSLFLV